MTDSIYTAINTVMGQVGYVKKQKSPNLNYTYAGEAALIKALRPEMVEQGIVINVEEIRDVVTREYQTQKGSNMTNVTLTAVFRLTHAPSGTFILATARGEGSDSGDKANNKAMTCAYKYMMRQTFVIETGDDPDRFQPAPRANDEQAQPPAEKPAPKNGKPSNGMNLEHALQFQTADKRYLKDLTWQELSENEAKALGVPENKRGDGWHKAYNALQVVMEYREREDEAAREAMNE